MGKLRKVFKADLKKIASHFCSSTICCGRIQGVGLATFAEWINGQKNWMENSSP